MLTKLNYYMPRLKHVVEVTHFLNCIIVAHFSVFFSRIFSTYAQKQSNYTVSFMFQQS